MFKLNQGVPHTSLRSFLSDTAISVLLFLVLISSNDYIGRLFKSPQTESGTLLLGFLVLLLLHPLGLTINGFSYFILSSWITRTERILYLDKRAMPYTKRIYRFEESKRLFGLKTYRDYRQRVEVFEELEFVLERFAATQDHTIGLEQFVRNIAAVAPPISCLYASQLSRAMNTNVLVTVLTLFAGTLAFTPLLVAFCARVRLYRGLFYLVTLAELNRYTRLRSLPIAKTAEEGRIATYLAINRLIKSDLGRSN